METMRQVNIRQNVQRDSPWLVALTEELIAGGVVVESLGRDGFLVYILGENAPKSTDYDKLTDTLVNAKLRVKRGMFGEKPIFGEITYAYPGENRANAYYFHKTLLNGAIAKF